MRNVFLCLSAALLLSGCVMVQSRVTVFHQLDGPTPKQFAMVPYAEQAGSLEHKAYSDLVRDQLVRRGWQETTREEAQVAVFLNYSVNGQLVNYSYPIYGKTGVASSFTSGTVTPNLIGGGSTVTATTTYTPTYGVVGSGSGTRREYERTLQVNMVDIPSFKKENKITRIYEGKVISEGSTGDLPKIMPYLVDAMFSEFPGNNGATRIVRGQMK